jgi:hypothetical protein
MNLSYNRWKKLFLFGLGLFAGTAFCMKWMENDFLINGEKFTILGLELFYAKEKVMTVLSGLDEHVKTILSYHLYFDFAFMAGVYPGIAALCMMAREKLTVVVLKKLLFVLAAMQLIAWAGDIAENLFLLKWIKHPVIGNEFDSYHFIVIAKWLIALIGAVVSLFALILRRKIKKI